MTEERKQRLNGMTIRNSLCAGVGAGVGAIIGGGTWISFAIVCALGTLIVLAIHLACLVVMRP